MHLHCLSASNVKRAIVSDQKDPGLTGALQDLLRIACDPSAINAANCRIKCVLLSATCAPWSSTFTQRAHGEHAYMPRSQRCPQRTISSGIKIGDLHLQSYLRLTCCS